MKSVLVLSTILFFTSLIAQNVVINEVLYDPDGSDSGYEWLELYNAGDDNIELAGWSIEKAGSEFEQIISFTDSCVIVARSYFLIGEEFVTNADLTCDLSLQNGGSATDGVRLLSADSLYTDTVLYDSPNSNGLPDDISSPGEFFAPDVSSGNTLARIEDGIDSDNCELDFFECTDPTPGSSNFYPIDLAVYALEISQTTAYFTLETYIHNLSTIDVDNSEAQLKILLNDSVWATYNLPALPALDSVYVSYQIEQFPASYIVTEIEVIYIHDNILDNNMIANSLISGNSPVIFNELLFKPADDNQEWIEIFNRGTCGYLVDNFVIYDAIQGEITFSGFIDTEDFLVICQDKNDLIDHYTEIDSSKVKEADSWTALNNTTETLILKDIYGTILDSTAYNGSSCPQDFSLERVNPYEDENIVWEISQNIYGATPTLANSVLPHQKDASIGFFKLEQLDDQLHHELTITNCGLQNISAVQFSCTALLDDQNPQLIQQESIAIDDSVLYSFISEIPAFGYTTFRYEIDSAEDLNPQNDLAVSFYNNDSRPFVVNEIMYDPADTEPEWLEIRINTFISDLTEFLLITNQDTLPITNFNSDFIVVTDSEEDAQFLIDKYELDIPVLFELGSLSNSGETITLLDPIGNIIETFTYSPNWNNGQDCYSIERINPFTKPEPGNWGASQTFCTPGAENSIMAFEYDVRLKFLGKELDGDQVEHHLLLENIGLDAISAGNLSCNYTINGSDDEIKIFEETIDLSDSLEYIFSTNIPSTGYLTYHYLLEAQLDIDGSNNCDYSFYNIDQLPFVINEIMYDPENAEPEWIELKNNHIICQLDTLKLSFGADTIFCDYQTEEYFLLTGSEEDVDSLRNLYELSSIPILTGLPSLSNAGEMLTIRDQCGNLIEAFTYLPSWNDQLDGISLERINPSLAANEDNWGPSITRATPGRKNSIFVQYLPDNSKLSVKPNPFSPYRAERTIVSIQLPEKLSTVTLRIFDLKGRLVRKLIDQDLAASRNDFIWDGKDKDRRNLPIGVYIILLEATARDSEKIYRKQSTVVIGK